VVGDVDDDDDDASVQSYLDCVGESNNQEQIAYLMIMITMVTVTREKGKANPNSQILHKRPTPHDRKNKKTPRQIQMPANANREPPLKKKHQKLAPINANE